jgi:hypothetical protein
MAFGLETGRGVVGCWHDSAKWNKPNRMIRDATIEHVVVDTLAAAEWLWPCCFQADPMVPESAVRRVGCTAIVDFLGERQARAESGGVSRSIAQSIAPPGELARVQPLATLPHDITYIRRENPAACPVHHHITNRELSDVRFTPRFMINGKRETL